jgi:hypothetical protein
MRHLKFFIPIVAAAALFSVPAANAGLIGGLLGTVTQIVLPTCGTASQVFKGVDGDSNSYYAFPNNGFESGSTGWSLTGLAFVGPGNEPWYVSGSGKRSLMLPAGASATSPSFCINLLDPTVRMFARGLPGTKLNIQVIFRGVTGNVTGILNHTTEGGTGAWEGTDPCSSALAVPLLTRYAQIKVTAATGIWQVDDAYVDPWVIGAG